LHWPVFEGRIADPFVSVEPYVFFTPLDRYFPTPIDPDSTSAPEPIT
jgi:hypothetical protein